MDIVMKYRLSRHGHAQFDAKLLTRTPLVLGSHKESANVPVQVNAALQGTVVGNVLEHKDKQDHAKLQMVAKLQCWRDTSHVPSNATLLTRMHLVRTRELATARDHRLVDALVLKHAVLKERVP